jgi:photoactive yellow protein
MRHHQVARRAMPRQRRRRAAAQVEHRQGRGSGRGLRQQHGEQEAVDMMAGTASACGAGRALDFGVIGFDADTTVVQRYNAFESQAAGLSPQRVIGEPLFTNVAPCLNNFMVAQRFEDAAGRRQRARRHHRLRADPAHAPDQGQAAPAGQRRQPMRYVLVQRR